MSPLFAIPPTPPLRAQARDAGLPHRREIPSQLVLQSFDTPPEVIKLVDQWVSAPSFSLEPPHQPDPTVVHMNESGLCERTLTRSRLDDRANFPEKFA